MSYAEDPIYGYYKYIIGSRSQRPRGHHYQSR